MLIIVKHETAQKGLSKLFSRQEYYIDTVNEKEFRFLLLTIKGGKKINWERLRQLLEENRGRVLLQEGLVPPAGLPLPQPDPLPYARCMMRNAAKKLLQRAKGQRENRVLLIDRELAFQEEAALLLRYCEKLTVLTDRTEGAPTLPAERVALLPLKQAEAADYTLVLAPQPSEVLAAVLRFGQTPVLIPSPEQLGGFPGTVLTAFTAPLPQRYAAFLPEQIDPYRFAAALYGCCGVTALGQTMPQTCDVYQNGIRAAKQVAF